MKLLLITLAILPSFHAFAAKRDLVSLDCFGSNRSGKIEFTAKTMFTADDKSSASLRDVKMTYNDHEGQDQVGRAADLESDEKFSGTKYKNHFRFNLNKLTDTKDFSKYYPDGCNVNIMIEKNVVTSNKSRLADVPVVMSCEQSGTTIFLDCKVATVR